MGTIIAHEAKQPIATLTNYLQIFKMYLDRKNDNDAFSKDVFENMENQVSRLNTLVNSVRNFAKQKQNPQVKTDLVLITQKAIRNLEATEPDIEKVKISFNSKLKTALVLADPFSLELLILNLLRNGAQEAGSNTAKGSPILKVELSLSNDNKSFILLVENSGKLMTDKDLSRLVSLGESVKPDGLGLGLSIIRGIADLHGADLGFTGRDKGGVIASLRIDQLHVEGGNVSEFLDTPELQDKVIVRLVDDDKDFLRSMKLMLEMMGWKVRDFSLAQDFLQEENFKVPGCIVLDMRMPGMTGLELQRQLINDKEKALPIIFLTGHGDVESAVHTLKRGAFDFLQKPVNPLKFNKTIEEACRLSLDNFGASLEDREVIKAFKSLTPREKEIFELAAGGKSNKEIAAELDIAVATVKMHRANAFEKMSVHSSIEALHKLNAVKDKDR